MPSTRNSIGEFLRESGFYSKAEKEIPNYKTAGGNILLLLENETISHRTKDWLRAMPPCIKQFRDHIR